MRASYFQNGEIYDVEEATKLPIRLAFLGLECWTDREGRFEWKPRELKLNIMPYDPHDFAAVLDAMQHGNLVQRYEVAGRSFGVINPELWRQQNINKNEAQSELPAPPPAIIARFESGSLLQGFHSYRDQPPSATVQASSDSLSGANLQESALSLEVKGSEVKGTEGNEDQKQGAGVPLEGVASEASDQPEPETPPPALSLEPEGEIIDSRAKPAPLPAVMGKRTMIAVRDRLAATEISAGTRSRVEREQLRVLQAEMVFGYWCAKTGHEKSILDPKRERTIVKQLEMTGGDVSELLYAIDGSLRDDHLQGRRPDSTRKYDGIETILRDRAQVERLADLMPKHRAGETHRIVLKYAEAMNIGGPSNDNGS
jgi:hypothetical protein